MADQPREFWVMERTRRDGAVFEIMEVLQGHAVIHNQLTVAEARQLVRALEAGLLAHELGQAMRDVPSGADD